MIVQEVCRKSGCSIQVHEEELRYRIVGFILLVYCCPVQDQTR